MEKSICSKPDCSGTLKRRGLCTKHYLEALETGELPRQQKKPNVPGDGSCSVPDCPRTSTKKGLCNSHYIRQQRHGDVNALKKIAIHESPEAKAEAERASSRRDYEKNKDAYKARADKWRKDNPERYAEYVTARLIDADLQAAARERTKKWSAENADRKRASDAKFKTENPHKVTAYKAKRRAAVLKACPAWLTDEHKEQIVSIYAEARRLTELTGTPHEVDHEVPLQGKTVSGLHVPWNLRVLPKQVNNRRPRVWIP